MIEPGRYDAALTAVAAAAQTVFSGKKGGRILRRQGVITAAGSKDGFFQSVKGTEKLFRRTEFCGLKGGNETAVGKLSVTGETAHAVGNGAALPRRGIDHRAAGTHAEGADRTGGVPGEQMILRRSQSRRTAGQMVHRPVDEGLGVFDAAAALKRLFFL